MSENQANKLPPGSIKSNRNGELLPGILVLQGEEHVNMETVGCWEFRMARSL
jgi:hypothetical protein